MVPCNGALGEGSAINVAVTGAVGVALRAGFGLIPILQARRTAKDEINKSSFLILSRSG
jgi:hypothetical protein